MRYFKFLLLSLLGAAIFASNPRATTPKCRNNIQVASNLNELNIEDAGDGVKRLDIVKNNHKISIEFEVETGEPLAVSDECQMAFGIVPDVRAGKLKWLKINFNNNLVTLPRTSYDRLYQTKIIKCQFSITGFELIIFGGDGADAYVCTLSFSSKRLKKKEIRAMNTSFPPSSEVTIYRDDYEDLQTGKTKK